MSSYYHAGNPHEKGFPFDAWAFAWLNGLFEHGRWSDHVAGWRAEALNNPSQVGFTHSYIPRPPSACVKAVFDSCVVSQTATTDLFSHFA